MATVDLLLYDPSAQLPSSTPEGVISDRLVPARHRTEAMGSHVLDRLLAERLDTLRTSITETTDWSKLFYDHATQDPMRPTLPGFQDVLSILCPGSNQEYAPQGTLDAVNILKDFVVLTEEHGYIIPTHEQEDRRRAPQPETIKDFIAGWRQQTIDAMAMTAPERCEKLLQHLPETPLAALSANADSLILAHKTPEPILEGLTAASMHIMRQFDAIDRQQIAAQQPAELQCRITGADLLRRVTGITNVQEWLSDQLKELPFTWLVTLQHLNITQDNVTREHNSKSQRLAGLAQYDHTLDLHLKMIFDHIAEKSKELHQKDPTHSHIPRTPESVQYNIRLQASEIVLHEALHEAHHHNIPIGQLREFIQITNTETIQFNDYVSDLHADVEAKKTGREIRDREDWVHSALDYLRDRDTLYQTGPRRFNYFNRLLQKYPGVVAPEN